MTLDMQAPTEPQPPPSSRKRKFNPVYEEKNKTHRVMSVLCGDVGCWALAPCGAVQLCFTYCIFTNRGRRIFAAVVPPLSTHFISSHTLILFLFWGGKQVSTSESIPGFETPIGGLVDHLAGVSILFVPFWNSPLSAHW